MNNMLTEQDLMKMCKTSNMPEIQEEEHTPIRKVYDATLNGAKTGIGAIGAGVAGIASLDRKAPVKIIP